MPLYGVSRPDYRSLSGTLLVSRPVSTTNILVRGRLAEVRRSFAGVERRRPINPFRFWSDSPSSETAEFPVHVIVYKWRQ